MSIKQLGGKGLLIISLALILIGSFFAGMFHSSFYSVKVKEISIQAEHGKLSGLLYMPKGAGADDPRPVIITTHGYLNTKEMQDAPAIEMSRRGYIVLALDMYDHGDSRWDAEFPVANFWGTFWVYSQYDAAKYIYEQSYTKKDEQGNAYVAVSGHSMGGFSSFAAMYFDEWNAMETGYRMIHAGISVGSDYFFLGGIAPQDQFQAAFGSRIVGTIAGQYDEFFFNKADAEKTEQEKSVVGTVVQKDYAATHSGKSFLGLAADDAGGEQGRFYEVQSGELLKDEAVVRASEAGQRVIYTPNETHPWNHFSKETTSNLIQFYNYAFKDVISPAQAKALDSNGQIWWFKEFFSLIALIGFFMLIVPVTNMLLRLPFLNRAVTEPANAIAPANTGTQKAMYWLAFIVSIIISVILFVPLIAKQADAMKTLSVISLILVAVFIIVAGAGLLLGRNKEAGAQGKHVATGSVLLAVISLVMWFMFKYAAKIAPFNAYFNEPIVNQILYWALASAAISALLLIAFHYYEKKKSGTRLASYGISFNFTAILSSLCAAIGAVAIVYIVLFIMEAIFGTDFRFWVLAARTFQVEHVITTIKYIPLFFIFYFVNTISLNANTRGKKLGYLSAIILNIGGLALWIALQYGKLFSTGVSLYPEQSLNGILLFALVPCLAIAAVYARYFYEKTNNVWLGAFLNTILFTLLTAANTALFWNVV